MSTEGGGGIAPAGDPAARISMWGATEGGKTTFLAALRLAGIRGSREGTRWRVSGVGKPDTKFLIDAFQELVEHRSFPPKTLYSGEYAWRVNGDRSNGAGSRVGQRLLRRGSRDFVFTVHDVPGEDFKVDSDPAHEMLDYLRRADGLIYLYDPVRDLTTADPSKQNLAYFQAALAELQSSLGESDELVGGRLPHRIAVCVAKFDDPAVFDLAMAHNWVNQDSNGARLPRVADSHAGGFFHWLCHQMPNDNAVLLRETLETNFVADRITYFVTSAIGFYVGPSGVFDEGDPNNVVWEDGSPRIRGTVRPINVLEPLLTLERKIRTGRW